MKIARIVMLVVLLLTSVGLVGVSALADEDMPAGQLTKIKGYLEIPPDGDTGEWVIDGITVQVVPTTQIDDTEGAAIAGARVMAWVKPTATGGLEVTLIRVLSSPNDEEVDQDQDDEDEDENEGEGEDEDEVRTAKPETVEFSGPIEQLPKLLLGRWVVDGRSLVVTPHAEIVGLPETGAMVSVQAYRYGDGILRVTRIEVVDSAEDQTNFSGTISKMPKSGIGWWIIGGQPIKVLPRTRIEGQPGIDQEVEGVAVSANGKVHVAISIRVVAPSASETVEPSETPTSSVVAPSETPAASVTAAAASRGRGRSGKPVKIPPRGKKK